MAFNQNELAKRIAAKGEIKAVQAKEAIRETLYELARLSDKDLARVLKKYQAISF
jgi:nucleoid DNA-binding protein